MIVLYINVVNGINSDGFNVRITDNDKELYRETYRYGYNASYSKENAEIAHQNVLNAIKHNWYMGYYSEKPYVSDIIKQLVKEYNVQDINVFSGIHMFNDTEYTQEELDKWADTYLLDL